MEKYFTIDLLRFKFLKYLKFLITNLAYWKSQNYKTGIKITIINSIKIVNGKRGGGIKLMEEYNIQCTNNKEKKPGSHSTGDHELRH